MQRLILHVLIKIPTPPFIPNRIPINPPTQLLMIEPIPVQLQPGLLVDSTPSKQIRIGDTNAPKAPTYFDPPFSRPA